MCQHNLKDTKPGQTSDLYASQQIRGGGHHFLSQSSPLFKLQYVRTHIGKHTGLMAQRVCFTS